MLWDHTVLQLKSLLNLLIDLRAARSLILVDFSLVCFDMILLFSLFLVYYLSLLYCILGCIFLPFLIQAFFQLTKNSHWRQPSDALMGLGAWTVRVGGMPDVKNVGGGGLAGNHLKGTDPRADGEMKNKNYLEVSDLCCTAGPELSLSSASPADSLRRYPSLNLQVSVSPWAKALPLAVKRGGEAGQAAAFQALEIGSSL